MKKYLHILVFIIKNYILVLKFSVLYFCLYITLRLKNDGNHPKIILADKNVSIHILNHEEYNFYDVDYFPSLITILKLFRAGPFPLNDSLIDRMVLHMKSVFDKNCDDTTELVVFFISEPKHFELRQNIRDTLGKNSTQFHGLNKTKSPKVHCTLFSIGYSSDFRLNQQLDWESYTEGDVIRVPLVESYRKTAHKIILTLFLLNKLNGSFQYILKVDDDIFIRMNLLIPYIRNLNETQVFIGDVAKGYRRFKDPKHKWYVSDLDYPGNVYKPYVLGFSELFRRNIIDRLAALHSKTRLIPMEDIHISYLVTKLGYALIDEPRFDRCTKHKICPKNFVVDIGKNMETRKETIASILSEQGST